ncbi:hypothetical protein KIH31_03320 [Paenarthrobacter sp. DKR-5]|uniref:hypothetical protein n=1 Tax=Paenarthrobacter sp. DKR-5 TaxID=2835535 RepID=UPI001BDC9479|nr:hypothetical protein [Paenarthrobacter sp. DKR-5]MBT1001623.1 hypothetical protein [Paenarthrobacter sp. DKR-5]
MVLRNLDSVASNSVVSRLAAAALAVSTVVGMSLVVAFHDFPVFVLAFICLAGVAVGTLRFAWLLWRNRGPNRTFRLRRERWFYALLGGGAVLGAAAAGYSDAHTGGLSSTGIYLVLLPRIAADAYKREGRAGGKGLAGSISPPGRDNSG